MTHTVQQKNKKTLKKQNASSMPKAPEHCQKAVEAYIKKERFGSLNHR